jgi:hypothetical protein
MGNFRKEPFLNFSNRVAGAHKADAVDSSRVARAAAFLEGLVLRIKRQRATMGVFSFSM